MFCVIQEIQLKKPGKGGGYQEYEVQSTSITFNGITKTHYSYYPKYESGHFERPIRTAYKISIHESYRENGKVKKKQCAIGTISYYQLILWGIYDYIDRGIQNAVALFHVDYDILYSMVESKLEPIKKKAEKEYHKTEEYKAHRQREKLQKAYQKAKEAFAKKYTVDKDEYDYCYNIFGDVMNKTYLDEIIKKAESYRSYSNYSGSTYNNGSSSSGRYDYSSYFKSISSTHTGEEKQMLKAFYKSLSMKFHPDMNPDTDTTKQMQLLNKLKDEWGL